MQNNNKNAKKENLAIVFDKGSLPSMVVSLWDVTEPLYIEISRSDGPQKGATTVDLTHLKSYEIIQTMSKGILSHSKSFLVI